MTCSRCWLNFKLDKTRPNPDRCPICNGQLLTWNEAVQAYKDRLQPPKCEQPTLFKETP